jgi:ABC-type tungstate transport system permease subunit
LNRYDVILLNPANHPVPKQAVAQRFAQWLLSTEGQAAIGAYNWVMTNYSTLRPHLQSERQL